jgi:hypothetical protein
VNGSRLVGDLKTGLNEPIVPRDDLPSSADRNANLHHAIHRCVASRGLDIDERYRKIGPGRIGRELVS